MDRLKNHIRDRTLAKPFFKIRYSIEIERGFGDPTKDYNSKQLSLEEQLPRIVSATEFMEEKGAKIKSSIANDKLYLDFYFDANHKESDLISYLESFISMAGKPHELLIRANRSGKDNQYITLPEYKNKPRFPT